MRPTLLCADAVAGWRLPKCDDVSCKSSDAVLRATSYAAWRWCVRSSDWSWRICSSIIWSGFLDKLGVDEDWSFWCTSCDWDFSTSEVDEDDVWVSGVDAELVTVTSIGWPLFADEGDAEKRARCKYCGWVIKSYLLVVMVISFCSLTNFLPPDTSFASNGDKDDAGHLIDDDSGRHRVNILEDIIVEHR